MDRCCPPISAPGTPHPGSEGARFRARVLAWVGPDPLCMDVHTIDGGVSLDDVAKAHEADLQTEGRDDVR